MLSRTLHGLLQTSFQGAHRSFISGLHRPKDRQLEVLKRIGDSSSWIHGTTKQVRDLKSLRDHFPISQYSDWRDLVAQQMSHKDSAHIAQNISRFEPTSGSSDEIKWIPYTRPFLSELELAYGPWLYDLFLRYPKIKRGHHYWSLSWLPTHLRNLSTNDADLFPRWKRQFLKKTMALDPAVARLDSSEEAVLASILTLLSKDISLISIWSPTFLLSLLETMIKEKESVIDYLKKKKNFHPEINIYSTSKRRLRNIWHLMNAHELSSELTKELWPNLALISSWDSSHSAQWAQTLRHLFIHCDFQAKGLWATEGVVTIPFQEHFPLALGSHFFEFENLETKEVHTAWELEKGMHVSPILTTSTGLMRYRLNDRLVIDDFLHATPCLTFQGRDRTSDLTGEKLAHASLEEISQIVAREFNVTVMTTLVVLKTKQYILLLNSEHDSSEPDIESVIARFEQLLSKHHHYQVARELGQLSRASVILRQKAIEYYYELAGAKIEVLGNIKIEPVLEIDQI